MSQKAVREFDGKRILSHWLAAEGLENFSCQCVHIGPHTNLEELPTLPNNEWLLTTQLVVKPDQLIKRRGKSGLIGLNMSFQEVIAWVNKHRNKPATVGKTTGILDTFIIEPFLPHKQSDEYYICIYSTRHNDTILFHHEGGVDIGDVNDKALSFEGPLDGAELTVDIITQNLLKNVPAHRKASVASFIKTLYMTYQSLHFSYLEINPLVCQDIPETGTQKLSVLDLAAKLDETATYLVGKRWNQATGYDEMIFPASFGRLTAGTTDNDVQNEQDFAENEALDEFVQEKEEYIRHLDAKTGASLKLTVLNPHGRVWTLIAGGGASVCFADSITSIPGFAHQLANYGEYSGAPNTQQTYDYTRTILELMTHTKSADIINAPKVLLIGGAIANFTDVAATFKGIIKALNEFKTALTEQNVKIFCRRGGPNYQEGLRLLRAEGSKMGLNINAYGPEVPMTAIVGMALGSDHGLNYSPKYVSPQQLPSTAQPLIPQSPAPSTSVSDTEGNALKKVINGNVIDLDKYPKIKIQSTHQNPNTSSSSFSPLFTPQTESIVYGLQVGAVQNMLDFDYICGRESPSVKCLVYPFNGNHYQKFYWNTKEILIPCLTSLKDAIEKYPKVSCVINFSSFRSVFDTSMEILQFSNQIKILAVIAEGVPERLTRLLIQQTDLKGVTFIGPATVGGIKPGCFRIGNAGGMLDNIISSKLYRPGSVAYVSKSGGLSNELNNLIAQNTDGVYEGLAIGGDRNPGSSFIPHLLRFQQDPNVKMIVMIGEVGGTEELLVCDLLKSGKITKPLISWCIGTVADVFTYDIQFGHAGACANGDMETASYKNKALKEAKAIVPDSFEGLGFELNKLYAELVEDGQIPLWEEEPPRSIPIDYKWASKLGLIRKPTNFISTISDERGEELTYAGVKISEIVSNPSFGGLGGTIGLLWFKKQLPIYFSKFIELVLCLTADHGPSVAGAHVAITTARAGRDLVSCLAGGLLTIGSRFGGALDESGRQFFDAFYVKKFEPEEFLQEMQKKKTLISGIGHKIKTLENPDSRVVEIKKFIYNHITTQHPNIKFPLLDYALKVEALTTKKKSNLILNVDGIVACVMVDLWMAHPNLWKRDEVEELLQMGVLNAFFILGRSIGLIGHVFGMFIIIFIIYFFFKFIILIFFFKIIFCHFTSSLTILPHFHPMYQTRSISPSPKSL